MSEWRNLVAATMWAVALMLAVPSIAATDPWSDAIVFASTRDGVNHLYRMSADGRSVQRLTASDGDNAWASWSPDGQRVVFTSTRNRNPDIYVMNADGSGQRQLTDHPAIDTDARWSPRGDLITFMSQRDFPSRIYVVAPDGTGLRPLTSGSDGDEIHPSFSPDGKSVAFVVRKGRKADLWVASVDGRSGGAPVNLTRDDGKSHEYPMWAPDGERIAFVTNERTRSSISVVGIDGSGRHQLTSTEIAFNLMPTWSPDGRQIAFVSDRRDGNRMNVYVMNADGTGVRNVSDSAFEDTHPSWARDGASILFTRIDRGFAEVFRVGVDGGAALQLTRSGNFDSSPLQRPAPKVGVAQPPPRGG